MCAANVHRPAPSFANGAKVHSGDHSFSFNDALSQELLNEIGKIDYFHIEEDIQRIEISPCSLGPKTSGVHQITILTVSGGEHHIHFKMREGTARGMVQFSSKVLVHEVTENCPEAKAYRLAEKMVGLALFEQGKAHLEIKREDYSLKQIGLEKINEVSEKWVIPISDILAIVRNGVGLVMIILLLTGMGPAVPAVLALALIFSILLIVQGTLFAFPQGTFAWGADGTSKFMVVRSLSDVKHMQGMALKAFSGFLSLVEGCLWIALGIAGIVPAFAGAVSILTFILFNVFFTGSFALMTGIGIRDHLRHKAFRNKLQGFLVNTTLPETQRYQKALEFLRDKMILRMKPKHVNYSETELLNKAARKIYRIQEQMNADMIAELEKVDELIAQMESDVTKADALIRAQVLVEKALKANEINLEYDKWTMRLGAIGFIVGGLIYNMLHILGFDMIGQAADFAAWMPLNLGFMILDVDWVVPALVEGNFKRRAKEKLVDPVVAIPNVIRKSDLG